MRRIRKANIKFISLVPAGANKIEPVYKTDGSISFGTLVKAADNFDEQGELTAVVYAPDVRDSQGDIADKEVVKQMAYDFIGNGGSVDINHDGKPLPKEKARVGETFLVQKTDSRFHGWKDRNGNPVDLEGAWATVIKIDDPALRKNFRSGEWAGVSMGGTAIVEQEKADLEEFFERLAKAVNPPKPKPEEVQMDKAEIKELFKEFSTELLKALKPEAPKTEPKEEPKEEQAPVFKGSWENDRDVQKHARALQMFALKKGTDMSDPDAIKAYSESIKVLKAEWAEEDKAAGIDTAPTRSASKPVNIPVGISKLDAELLEAGRLIAESLNKK